MNKSTYLALGVAGMLTACSAQYKTLNKVFDNANRNTDWSHIEQLLQRDTLTGIVLSSKKKRDSIDYLQIKAGFCTAPNKYEILTFTIHQKDLEALKENTLIDAEIDRRRDITYVGKFPLDTARVEKFVFYKITPKPFNHEDYGKIMQAKQLSKEK